MTAPPVPDPIREAARREAAKAPAPSPELLHRLSVLFAPAVRACLARRAAETAPGEAA